MVAVKFTCAQSAQKGQHLTAHPVDGPLTSVAPLRWEAEGRVQCRNVVTIAMTTPGGNKERGRQIIRIFQTILQHQLRDKQNSVF